jgi:hypothetical protein
MTATADLPGAVETAKIVDRSATDIQTFSRWLQEAKLASEDNAGNKTRRLYVLHARRRRRLAACLFTVLLRLVDKRCSSL